MRRDLRHVLPVERDRALGRRKIAADHIEERRLARPIRADDRTQLAGFYRHPYVAHGNQAAKSLGNVADFEHGQLWPRNCRIPSSPRGKKSTTSTKIAPTNDIQFTVIDEM